MEKLKSCPFCGGDAKIFKRAKWWYVKCSNRSCFINDTSSSKKDKEQAIKAWNKRIE